MPPSRRSEDNFDKHFTEAGLFELVTFRKAQQNTRIKKKLRGEIGTEVLYCIYMTINTKMVLNAQQISKKRLLCDHLEQEVIKIQYVTSTIIDLYEYQIY